MFGMGALWGLQKNYVKQPIECPENKLQSRGRAEMQRILSSVQKLPEEKKIRTFTQHLCDKEGTKWCVVMGDLEKL